MGGYSSQRIDSLYSVLCAVLSRGLYIHVCGGVKLAIIVHILNRAIIVIHCFLPVLFEDRRQRQK